MAVVLAIYGAAYGLIVGLVLYFFVQRSKVFGRESSANKEDGEEKVG